MNGEALALQAQARTGEINAFRRYYFGRENWKLAGDFFQYLYTGKDPRDPKAPEPVSRTRTIIFPPGFGKSTMIHDWIIKLIAEDRNIRILLGSKGQRRSTQTSMKVGHHLEANGRIIQDHGPFKGRRWTQAEFEVSERDVRLEAPTLRAIGTKTDALGPRCDVFIGDDLLDLDNTKTPYRRQSFHDWLTRIALSRLDPPRGKPFPYGADIYIGNFWHRQDEYNEMISDGRVNPFIVKAYLDDERKVSALPEMYSPEHLEIIRFRDAMAFEQLFMMDLKGMVGQVFDRDWERFWTLNPKDLDPEDNSIKMLPSISSLRIEQAWDLSGGDDPKKGDYTASAILGEDDRTGNVYVLWGWKKRVPVHEQLTMMESSARMANPRRVLIEKNFNPAVTAFAARRPALRRLVIPTTTPSTFSKTERVRLSLQALTARGQLFFPFNRKKWLWPGDSSFRPRDALNDFFDFPDGAKDFVDAVEIARRQPWKRQAVLENPVLTTTKRRY